ncbi:MAG: ATP-binding cassette domain-containing protein [Pseudomonadota bacterium]|nr:ATP-binding cassette domain-containing protein [Pseudomonadota bacterium]
MTSRLSVSLHAVSVRRGEHWALRNISLRLEPGERWALIGGNGAGKTQLLKLIGTDVWPTPTGLEVRAYRVGRRAVDVIEAKRRITYIGAELQDKYARYGWNPTVFDLLGTGLHRTDLLQRPIAPGERRRVRAMLELCGLTHLQNRGFSSLSYGQKRLALLARGLLQRPDWLLLDEFYNGLDGPYRGRIDRLLAGARARGQSWIISAHRAADVPPGTQGLIELRHGRLHAVTQLRAADLARLRADAAEPPPVLAARPAADRARRTARMSAPGTAGTARGTVLAPARTGVPLLRITGADLYVDYRLVLRDIHWDLRAGEHWAVFGANGAGKSSFLKLLYGELSPALGGRIDREGFPRGTAIEAWKRQVGYLSPELQTDYAVNVTVFDLVASGRYASIGLCDAPTALDKKYTQHWLEFFRLSSMAGRRPGELSYGQMRRALFARALTAGARILLLDEPLTGLDPRQRAAMKRLLERLMKQHVTLVIAAHHPEDLPRGMTRALHLHRQRAETVEYST